LGTIRDELVACEEPRLYNNFIRQLRKKRLGEGYGG
jgi:hypothetical protein